jgi:hypothetical protein
VHEKENEKKNIREKKFIFLFIYYYLESEQCFYALQIFFLIIGSRMEVKNMHFYHFGYVKKDFPTIRSMMKMFLVVKPMGV